MAEYWKITCKDCGDEFEYSDYILQMDIKKGLSRPERCNNCRTTHSSEIRAVGNSHFELIPLKTSPSILGTPFIGMIDHKGRSIEKLDIPDESKKMDLGLMDEKENTIKEIYEELDIHQVIIIVAATGTGKSTYFPFRLAFPLLYEKNNDPNKYLKHGPIVVTQPRKIATEGIAQAIAKNLCKSFVGEGFEIGFKYSDKEDYSINRNRLIFVTDGSLLNWISQGKIGQFSAIVIDEAHERSKNIDVILSLIKCELPKYPHLKLIVLSATIDSKSFEDFFKTVLPDNLVKVLNYTDERYAIKKFKYEEKGDWKWTDLDLKSEIEYKQNENDLREANNKLKEYIKAAPREIAQKVVELLKDNNGEGGILAFLPGVGEIKQCVDEIHKIYTIDKRTRLFELHSNLSEVEIAMATEPFKEEDKITFNGKKVYPRRVVIATNIAETSITFDDIVHVIDSGLIKQSHWDAIACVQYMRTQFHSKDGCKQRWGRAGRKMDGYVYKLYPRDWFVRYFPHHTSPEIERCCLDDVFLNSIENGVTDVSKLSWLTQPDSIEFSRVQNVLSERKLVDDDGDLTNKGREVLNLRKSIGKILQESDNSNAAFALDIATLFVLSDKYGCLIEAATLASAIPHLGASMFVSQNEYGDLKDNRNGFFIWNYDWDLITKDYYSRMLKELQIGCLDDLDFVFKLSILFDFYESKEIESLNDFIIRYFICEKNVNKYLYSRDSLIYPFVKNISEMAIRSVDYKQINKLRLLVQLAFPDKLGEIVNSNGQLVFRNKKGFKYLLSPNIAGNWKEGDKAVVLMFKQSPYIIDKNPEKLIKDTPSSPYAEFLIKAQDSELYQENDLSNYEIIQYLKQETIEENDEIVRNMLTPIIASSNCEVKAIRIDGMVSVKDIVRKTFLPKMNKVVLEQESDGSSEMEYSEINEKNKRKLKIKINSKIRSIFNEIESFCVIDSRSNILGMPSIERWEIIENKTVAFLTTNIYYRKDKCPEIEQQDFVEVNISREIVDKLNRNRVGYMVTHFNKNFPVPIENMSIDPFIPFQESLVGKFVYLQNYKIKSLPFYYGLTVLPLIEGEIKSIVAARVSSIGLIAIKNDRNSDTYAYFRIENQGVFPLYLSVKFVQEFKFTEQQPFLVSFKIAREKVMQKSLGDAIIFKNDDFKQILHKHNFIFEGGLLKCKDIRSVEQFFELFDEFYKSTSNYKIYEIIRRLYSTTFSLEIQMEAIFEKVIKDIHSLIEKLGSITPSQRDAFQIEIRDYQHMLQENKHLIEPLFNKLNEISSALWNLDFSEIEYKKKLIYYDDLYRKISRENNEKKQLELKEKRKKVEKEIDISQNIRAGLFETIEKCKQYVIDQISSLIDYGVKIVGENENYKTIQSAIDDSNDGDLILIMDGYYNESLVITKNIILKNLEHKGENVIIHSGNLYTIIVKSDRVCLNGIVIEQEDKVDENEQLHAAIFSNAKSLFLYKCKIKSVSNIGIENDGRLYLYDCILSADRSEGTGILALENSFVNVSKSQIYDCGCGIYSNNSIKISILNCIIKSDVGVSLNGNNPTIFYESDNNWSCYNKIGGNALTIRNL